MPVSVVSHGIIYAHKVVIVSTARRLIGVKEVVPFEAMARLAQFLIKQDWNTYYRSALR